MGKRREARERAVQFLFQHDLNPPENLEAALAQFWSSQRTAAIAEDKGGKRNVLKRFERTELLKKRGQWKDGDRITGLRKTKPEA